MSTALPPSAAGTESPKSQVSRSRVISNSILSVVTYALSLPLALFVNSFVVHHIGLHQYGIWAALTTIMSYGGVLDLGVSVPVIKYVAEYMARGNRDEVNDLIGTAMMFYLAVAVLFLLAMTFASGWILIHLFHTSPNDTAMRQLYFAIVVGFALSLVFSVLVSLIVGLQRADLIAKLNFAFSVAGSLGNILLVALGFGVQGLAIVWFASTVLNIVATWICAKLLFPSLALNPLRFTLARLRVILNFSTKVQVTNIMLLLNDQVDRTLIAYALGPAQLGYYQLAARATSAVRGLSFSLMAGVLPAASGLAAVGDSSRLQALYVRGTRYLAITDFALCLVGIGLAGPFVRVIWLGGGYTPVVITMQIILLSYAVWLPSQALENALMGRDRPEIRMHADIVFLIIHLPLSSFLLWRFGFYGTVVGTAIALISTRLYVFVAGAHALGADLWDLIRASLLQPAIAGLLALGAVVGLRAILPLPSLAVLGIDLAAAVAIYGGYTALFALDPYDRRLILSLLHGKALHPLRAFSGWLLAIRG